MSNVILVIDYYKGINESKQKNVRGQFADIRNHKKAKYSTVQSNKTIPRESNGHLEKYLWRGTRCCSSEL